MPRPCRSKQGTLNCIVRMRNAGAGQLIAPSPGGQAAAWLVAFA